LIQADLWGLTWRPTFLVNLPLGVLTLVASSILLVNQQAPSRPARLDVAGVGIVTVALLLLVIPLISGREAGWPLWMLGSLVVAFPVFAAFGWFEQRLAARGGSPLVNLALFQQRAFLVGVLIALAFFAGNAGFLFVFTLFLQLGLGFSPLHAGLTFVPYSAGFFVASLLTPRLIPVLGRGVLSLGYFTTALGVFAILAFVQVAGPSLSSWALVPALLIQGFGQGLGLTPLVGTIVSRVQSRDAGAAAGIVATSFQVGNVLGIAVVGLIFFLFLGVQATGSAHAAQYVAAISGTLPFIAALALIPYGLVFLLPRAEAEGTDVFLERLPQQAAVIAYALYFLTGGHVSGHFIDELRNRTIQRKTARGEAAPLDLATYLVYNYTEAGEDQEWIKFIMREALSVGNGPVIHEEERRQVIAGFVDEIRQRQAEGHIAADLHPASLRLMVFALTTCPHAFPQITRMLTGYAPTDPAFEVEWTHFLRQLGQRLAVTNDRGHSSHP
jgi:Tetracyclin repressor-like, C-terminal domain